jgi:hypothetical protein
MTATLDSTTTVTGPTVEEMVLPDLYIDPVDAGARVAMVGQVRTIADLLDQHAHHEDIHIVPTLEVHAPELAEVIHEVHPVLDGRVEAIRGLAAEVETTGGTRTRAAVHSLYLELASFTGAYLEHVDFEERRCMRALADALPVEAVMGIEQAIVSSIPPDEMATALSLMLPAMNVDDRVEMLGGMQQGAPPEVFAGVCALAASVLEPPAWANTATRLGIA